tara:strand:- start:7244 stop:7384 length:141 start_codon:yes stop_codon:yes gene_type:complete
MIRILFLRLIAVQEVEKSDQGKRVNLGFEIDRKKVVWRKSDYGLDV